MATADVVLNGYTGAGSFEEVDVYKRQGKMRVWIYTRLSNDDDPERDSLQNQERICREFAAQRGDNIVCLLYTSRCV